MLPCGNSLFEIRERDIHVQVQSLAAISIPTDICVNMAAAVSTGDLSDEIMIEKCFLLTVIEIFSDPALIPSTVFRFLHIVTRNHAICHKDNVFEFCVSHSPSPTLAVSQYLQRFIRQYQTKSLSGGGRRESCHLVPLRQSRQGHPAGDVRNRHIPEG